ncbi:MAG: hypothetical protein HY306_00865 [Nitrosomonadales bacterium]|nr:hypothetical protein [Nitrosomonadales bacterium]
MTRWLRIDRARLIKGLVALIAACVLNRLGDRMLGVTVELYRGIQGFGGLWIVDVFVLPFFVGLLVTAIYGFGGKWLSYFPPLIVRAISYYEIAYITGTPAGASLAPIGWWGFFVILAVEASAFGGIMGEIMMKSVYGRSPRHKIYKERSGKDGSDIEAS